MKYYSILFLFLIILLICRTNIVDDIDPYISDSLVIEKIFSVNPRLKTNHLEIKYNSQRVTNIECITKNVIDSLPPEIGKLNQLEDLSLPISQLRNLPTEIGQLTKLKMLNLYNNTLSTLPPEIGNLSNLGYLHLELNILSTLPPEIGNLNNLEALILSKNQIQSLPTEIGQLTKLKMLALDSNYLTALPNEIVNLKSMIYLELTYNKLSVEKNADGSWKYPWQVWATKYDSDWYKTQKEVLYR